MDGLIVRSVMLSNHIADKRSVLEEIALRRGGLGNGYKETSVSQRIWKKQAASISQHRAPKTILKYY